MRGGKENRIGTGRKRRRKKIKEKVFSVRYLHNINCYFIVHYICVYIFIYSFSSVQLLSPV